MILRKTSYTHAYQLYNFKASFENASVVAISSNKNNSKKKATVECPLHIRRYLSILALLASFWGFTHGTFVRYGSSSSLLSESLETSFKAYPLRRTTTSRLTSQDKNISLESGTNVSSYLVSAHRKRMGNCNKTEEIGINNTNNNNLNVLKKDDGILLRFLQSLAFPSNDSNQRTVSSATVEFFKSNTLSIVQFHKSSIKNLYRFIRTGLEVEQNKLTTTKFSAVNDFVSESSTARRSSSATKSTTSRTSSGIQMNEEEIVWSNVGPPRVVVGTRIHLGKSSSAALTSQPLDQNEWDGKIHRFLKFCYDSCPPGSVVVIAVDRTKSSELVDTIQRACDNALNELRLEEHDERSMHIRVIPVSPWGEFVPALNAITSYAARTARADYLLLVSLEVTANASTIQRLIASHTVNREGKSWNNSDTLVAGVRLPGHEYKHDRRRDKTAFEESEEGDDPNCTVTTLNGLTSPWNTLALWNVPKLARTGFQLVSEGLVGTDAADEATFGTVGVSGIAGIEEVVTIAMLQQLLGRDNAKAKLINVDPDDEDEKDLNIHKNSAGNSMAIQWDTADAFKGDEGRQKWHREKMKSKYDRAQAQLSLLPFIQPGVVHHC